MSSIDPIHGAFSTPPPTYPLGVSISDKVTIKEIDRRAADAIYEAHHSYISRGRLGWHYGVFFEGETVGAITFSVLYHTSEMHGYEKQEIKEVGRVCIAHDTPNLASCAMAKAQDKFIEEKEPGTNLLVTYVKQGYSGAMFSALADKGWHHDGHITGPSTPGNDPKQDIHDETKKRWICEV